MALTTRTETYLDTIYDESLQAFAVAIRRRPEIATPMQEILSLHQLRSVMDNERRIVPVDMAAKILFPEYDEDGYYDIASMSEREAVNGIASTLPEYYQAVSDYVAWTQIYEAIYSMAFDRYLDEDHYTSLQYEDERQGIIRDIAKTGKMDEAKAQERFNDIERIADLTLRGKKTQIDRAIIGDPRHESPRKHRSPKYRAAFNRFMDDMLGSDQLYANDIPDMERGYMGKLKLTIDRLVDLQNQSPLQEKLNAHDLLTIVNAQAYESCNHIPIMWHFQLSEEKWNLAQRFMKEVPLAREHAENMVYMRYGYGELFDIVYRHQQEVHDLPRDAFAKEIESEVLQCAEQLNRLCPSLKYDTAVRELCAAIAPAREAITIATHRTEVGKGREI